MPTTSNFGWTTPADTDLVKDGALAIRTLGNGIDTSFLDLKGGTTGQVLSKASNTDLDFTWVAQDDADAIQKSLIDAEGDLIVGDAADAVQRLAIGSNGNVLTVDTSVDGKIKWAAPAGGGKVLQVVQGTLTSNATTTSGSYVDTGLTVNITPSSASSKVYVVVNFWGYVERSGSVTANVSDYRLVRTSTQLQKIKSGATNFASTSGPFHYFAIAFSYLDSPATTSATTYKIQFAADTATNTTAITAGADTIASIVAMEIGA